ncbi:MAG: hypothetical protein WC934_06020, partial [Acidithiobacillus sp.]|uniref:hypothetical protein n=1 Tax=Acidithiobacillus sp. TaxID=1872118 RepID=UPI00356063E3
EQRRKKGSFSNLNLRFDINVPTDDDEFFHNTIKPEMIQLVNKKPTIDGTFNGEIIIENINKCPPCIYYAYILALTKRGQFQARVLLVHFFANTKSKYSKSKHNYTPSDIAGFFKYHINNDEDNIDEDRVRFYTAWAYGEINDPYSLEGCLKIQKLGFCINFSFKEIESDSSEIEKIQNIIRGKKSKIQENINDITNWVYDEKENPEKYKNIDLKYASDQFNDDNLELHEQIITELDKIKQIQVKYYGGLVDNYNIKCERIWHPFSINNEYKQIRAEEFRLEYEDALNYDENENNVEFTQTVDDNDVKEEPVINKDDIIDEINKNEQYKKEVQCYPESEYSEINDRIHDILYKIISSSDNEVINEIIKTTRVGVTTSLSLSPILWKLRTLLCVPTNAIGLDTFSKTVKISEQKAQLTNDNSNKIYGCVFGSNLNMCLKIYKLVQEDLPEKHGKAVNELAIINNLPFIFKKTCVNTSKNGEVEVCPYWNCIYIGYPKDDKGSITPIVKSQLMKVNKDTWCTYKHHHVLPTDTCLYAKEFGVNRGNVCSECKEYFKRDYEYVDKDSRPYCAYASIYRHLIQDLIKIRVHESSHISKKIFEFREIDVVHLSRNEVYELIKDGFIPVNSFYRDKNRMKDENISDLQGLLDEDGELKNDIQLIKGIQTSNGIGIPLKTFDVLALTYTKIIALHQSVKNAQIMQKDNPNVSIINAIKRNFHGVICDEVSHLVSQSPLSVSVYSVLRNLDQFGNEDDDVINDFFTNVDKELEILNEKVVDKIKSREQSREHRGVLNDDDDMAKVGMIDYFNALIDYFKIIFGKIKHWCYNPSQILDLFSKTEIDQYNRIGKHHNKVAFDIIMEQVKANKIPIEIKQMIQKLQNRNYLNKNAKNIRYINVAEIRIRMKQIIREIKRYLLNIHRNTSDEDVDIESYYDIDDEQVDIENKQLQYQEKINE